MRYLWEDRRRGHRDGQGCNHAITGYIESLIEDGETVPLEEELIECRLTVEANA
jgi:hypothetical protein